MDDTWYKIPWRVFCIGKLGAAFCNLYQNKLGAQFTCHVLDNPYELKPFYDSEVYHEEHWMLIAEYDQEIWNKYLVNDEIEKFLQNTTLRFIMTHPVNNVLSPIERQFVQLMWNEPPANFDPDFPHTIILAMPNSSLRVSLEVKSSAIYDMIASVYLPGLVSQDYLDLVGPGECKNIYGLVYKAHCASCEQMVQTTKVLAEHIIKDIPTESITCVRVMIFSDREVTLERLAGIGYVLEDAFNEKDIVWSQHNVSESECGMTVVVYRELADKCVTR